MRGVSSGFLEFLGSQILLVGALPFLLLPWIFALRRRLCGNPQLQVFYYFFLPPLAFFLVQSLRKPLEGNWGLATYLCFWPLAQTLFEDNSFKTAGRVLLSIAMAPALVVSGAILIHSVRPLQWIPPEKDRYYRLVEQGKLASRMAADLKLNAAEEVLHTPTYQWTSVLRYFGAKVSQVPHGRRNHYSLAEPSAVCGRPSALVLSLGESPDPALACFDRVERLSTYALVVRGKEVAHYHIHRLTSSTGNFAGDKGSR